MREKKGADELLYVLDAAVLGESKDWKDAKRLFLGSASGNRGLIELIATPQFGYTLYTGRQASRVTPLR